jgi:hypothetical protein
LSKTYNDPKSLDFQLTENDICLKNMINLSRLSSLALDSNLGRIPRLLETQTRYLYHAPDCVQPAPVDGQIAIPTESQLPARAQVFFPTN